MVYRIYVEKKPGFAHEAKALLEDLRSFLGIKGLTDVRVLNRYDAEHIDEALFRRCVPTVFSEPQLDDVYDHLPSEGCDAVFATEYLPGQFDQRADSAAQCVQLASRGERPLVRTAKAYLLYGDITEADVDAIRRYVVNPVESRPASLDRVDTLDAPVEQPDTVETLTGFTAMDEIALAKMIKDYALAMDLADIRFSQAYFAGEKRDPTLTELRMIDTYWSDHCRHTTFLTHLDSVVSDSKDVQEAFDRYLAMRKALGSKKPVTLMDMATIGAKYLKKTGKLNDMDESEEINACTVKIQAEIDGRKEDWLLLFKNETHNHPTEIEPFGGAATCIGGAIRDPLSGRGYVYQAMRVTGAADPTRPVSETIPGKLPQKKLVTTAAAGYSSYGNQIGLATGLVDEIYHPGYAAKRLEIGAVVGAAPARNVRREEPVPGDVIVLLGGRTGRDGCGGATGSSKSHDATSLAKCGAEVQKGNAPEERKLQRLFRNPEATRLIKRCNDFGAGGVSVAIGELADGLAINLDAVPKKYEGLDGTELAISESQERMAVVLAKADADKFLALADGENLEATPVAVVTEAKRLTMTWKGRVIVDLSREFLNSNGAPKSATARVEKEKPLPVPGKSFAEAADDLNCCSKRGLCERFDSTIGAASVLMPFGGRRQTTPAQVMAAKLPVLRGDTDDCSVMSYGFNPYAMEASPYHGAYLSVVESVCKLVASGAGYKGAHLTFQEYFERLHEAPERWGKPVAALLGALDAQTDLGIAAIGGKDSMSGSFENIDVPPTLVSFAINMAKASRVISPEFKRAGNAVALIQPETRVNGLPDKDSLIACMDEVTRLIGEGRIVSAYAVGFGGVNEALLKMCMGNGLGFAFDGANVSAGVGAFVAELAEACLPAFGHVTDDGMVDGTPLARLEEIYEAKLEKVYPACAQAPESACETVTYRAERARQSTVHVAKPRVLIPVFPGTNCEYDAARAFEKAGAQPEIMVVNNLSAAGVRQSAERFAKLLSQSQILFLPGGFSGGDEPDGSGKFITAFLRNPLIRDEVSALLGNRDGLIGGICNGFQALIKLGLLPFGEIREAREDYPTLTYNVIGRHQSRLVRARVASNLSPWMMHETVGEVQLVPVSHGEGRFIASDETMVALIRGGQIATQYVDENGVASMDIRVNPNGSRGAVEGITSPDGRVFGRMAHSERTGENLYRNVPGDKTSAMFRGAADYFRA